MFRKLLSANQPTPEAKPLQFRREITSDGSQSTLKLIGTNGMVAIETRPGIDKMSVTVRGSDAITTQEVTWSQEDGMLTIDASLFPKAVAVTRLLHSESKRQHRRAKMRECAKNKERFENMWVAFDIVVPEGTNIILEQLYDCVIAPGTILGDVTIDGPQHHTGNVQLGTTKSLTANLSGQQLSADDVQGEILSLVGCSAKIAHGSVHQLVLGDNSWTDTTFIEYGGSATRSRITSKHGSIIKVERLDGDIFISATGRSEVTINRGEAAMLAITGELSTVQHFGTIEFATVTGTGNGGIVCTFGAVTESLHLDGEYSNNFIRGGETAKVHVVAGRFDHLGTVVSGYVKVAPGTTCYANDFGPHVRFEGMQHLSRAAVGFKK